MCKCVRTHLSLSLFEGGFISFRLCMQITSFNNVCCIEISYFFLFNGKNKWILHYARFFSHLNIVSSMDATGRVNYCVFHLKYALFLRFVLHKKWLKCVCVCILKKIKCRSIYLLCYNVRISMVSFRLLELYDRHVVGYSVRITWYAVTIHIWSVWWYKCRRLIV